MFVRRTLNCVFSIRYERYKKNQEKNQRQMQQEPSLIDFGAEGAAASKLGGLTLNSKENDDADFDSFAQSRNEPVKPSGGKDDGAEVKS